MVFIVDAVLASLVVILGIILIRAYDASSPDIRVMDYTSQDLVKVLANLKVREYANPYVISLINQSKIRYVNNSLLEQIGEFWAGGDMDEARNLSRILLGDLVPSGRGVGIFINGESIYVRNITATRRKLWRQGKIVSGIAKDKPYKGILSRAFLRAEPKKRTAYAFFGGYVGDGNITATMDLLSGLINVTRMVMEMDVGTNFTLTINGNPAGDYQTAGIERQADTYVINSSSILGAFQEGNNSLIIGFTSPEDNFIGGGFIRVEYESAGTPDAEPSQGENVSEQKMLPGIDGIINLYDSFVIPGNLTAMQMYLHYTDDFFLRVVIGNTTVLLTNQTADEILLDNDNLSSQLDYAAISGKTVPLRVRSQINGEGQGRGADVILITDLSGSMNWRIGYADSTWGAVRSCDDPQLYDADSKRISVAKCLDKEFTTILLNNTPTSAERNRIGLVGYTGVSPDGIVSSSNLTNDLDSVHQDIDTYPDSPSGGTCIACAITKAKELIQAPFQLVRQNSLWLYSLDFQAADEPENDSLNNTWLSSAYNDSRWDNGTAILGFPDADTIIGSSVHADLWELGADTPAPVDFTSGLNSSANTFGISGADDGWDWQSGIYDNTNAVTFDGVNNGRLEIYAPGSSSPSGGYGILWNVTQQMVDAVANGSSLVVGFDYEWSGNSPKFEGSDHVWIKARLHNPNGSVVYLGSELEGGDTEADPTPEIAYADNPNNGFSGSFQEDISGLVADPGQYYLDMGVKLNSNRNNEWGYAYFDNIDVHVQPVVGNVFFRKRFTVYGDSIIENAFLKVRSDDAATVWLNGNMIDNDTGEHTGQYWNREITFSADPFIVGTNQLAVRTANDDATSLEFDLELSINDSGRIRHIITMTDGIPGYSYPPLTFVCGGNAGDCNTGVCDAARNSTITASCEAHNETNATIHSVGFGDLASCTIANETLYGIAACGNGNYSSSANASELLDIYRNLALNIISQTFEAQTSFVQGTTTPSILYPDSYIRFNYTSTALPAVFGTVEIGFETPAFGDNTTIGSLDIPSQLTITQGQLTSYSGSSWTDRVEIRNALYPSWTTIYSLEDWSSDYADLGDPFEIMVPPAYFSSGGLNEFRISTGLSPDQPTNGSIHDRLIFRGRFDAVVNYTQITSQAEGCLWSLDFEDNSSTQMPVPPDYAGANVCDFASGTYNADDALQSAAFALFSAFDFDGDGKLFFNPEEVNLLLDQIQIEDVPSLWGPSVIEVRVWE
ncbi:MAG: hypothetical protein GXP63_03420 [DPANN group archaeon]|nr:hypothetical protein [DPANN group archaeon]